MAEIVGYATNAYSLTASPVVDLSAVAGWTPQENDCIVIYLACTNTFTFQLPLAGYNLIVENVDVGDSSTEAGAFYHWVSAGEAASASKVYTMTDLFGAGGEAGRWWAVVVRGVDTTEPLDGFGTWLTAGDTDTAHFLAPIAGTGLDTGSLVLRFLHTDGANRTYNTPVGHTKLMDGGTNNGGWAGYRNAPTSAGVDVPAEPITPSTGDEGVSISIALRPSADGPKVAEGGSSAGLEVSGLGAGFKLVSVTGGSPTASVGVVGTGIKRTVAAGGFVSLAITSAGSGQKRVFSSSSTPVYVGAFGVGYRPPAQGGGSAATVGVSASGSGYKLTLSASSCRLYAGSGGSGHKSASGGSLVDIYVTALGRGGVPGASRDIRLQVGVPIRSSVVIRDIRWSAILVQDERTTLRIANAD